MWPLFTMQNISMYLCVSDWYWANTTKPHLDSTSPFWFALLQATPEWVSCSEKEVSLSVLSITMERTKLLLYIKVTHTEALVFLSQGEFLSSVIFPAPPTQEAKLHGSDQGLEQHLPLTNILWAAPKSPSLPGWRHRAGEEEGGQVSPALQRK